MHGEIRCRSNCILLIPQYYFHMATILKMAAISFQQHIVKVVQLDYLIDLLGGPLTLSSVVFYFGGGGGGGTHNHNRFVYPLRGMSVWTMHFINNGNLKKLIIWLSLYARASEASERLRNSIIRFKTVISLLRLLLCYQSAVIRAGVPLTPYWLANIKVHCAWSFQTEIFVFFNWLICVSERPRELY